MLLSVVNIVISVIHGTNKVSSILLPLACKVALKNTRIKLLISEIFKSKDPYPPIFHLGSGRFPNGPIFEFGGSYPPPQPLSYAIACINSHLKKSVFFSPTIYKNKTATTKNEFLKFKFLLSDI